MIEVKTSISRERLYMRNYESDVVNIVSEGLGMDVGDYYTGMASFLALMHLSGLKKGEDDNESSSVRTLLI
jgi:hypothetical protein